VARIVRTEIVRTVGVIAAVVVGPAEAAEEVVVAGREAAVVVDVAVVTAGRDTRKIGHGFSQIRVAQESKAATQVAAFVVSVRIYNIELV
jgi:hypothetical protein